MNYAATIAQAVRDFASMMGEEVKTAKNPEQQEAWIELISIMRRMARCLDGMTFEEAKATIADFDEPEKGIIMDLLAKKGIFF